MKKDNKDDEDRMMMIGMIITESMMIGYNSDANDVGNDDDGNEDDANDDNGNDDDRNVDVKNVDDRELMIHKS